MIQSWIKAKARACQYNYVVQGDYVPNSRPKGVTLDICRLF
jgi:hypothetical protein